MSKFKVTFQPMNVMVEADEAAYPYGDDGLPGSVLDIALAHGVNIEHACGGVGACGTCHVIVSSGAESLSPPTDEELDVVEQAPGSGPSSRLACRAVVRGDVTVTIPAWNRNA
jgi:2Fe-2S ferredoxin